MKYIFFGTPRFAEIILGGLVGGGEMPVAVVCNPDRPVGRKKIITPPATKVLVEKHNAVSAQPRSPILIFQPEKLSDLLALQSQLTELKPDFFVVAAYAKIIPQAILDIPRLGTIGVHPSLLPLYRGASPIQSAILGGEIETGVTLYLMDKKTDHGPILAQEKLIISGGSAENNDNHDNPAGSIPYPQLEQNLAKLSAKLLLKIIPDFAAGNMKPQVQDESKATFTKKFKADDGFVDEKELAMAIGEHGDHGKHSEHNNYENSSSTDTAKKASEILKKINALNPEPGAWTIQGGKRIKLLKAEIRDGQLVLLETQKEGERPKFTRSL